jgi:hypothetical protein
MLVPVLSGGHSFGAAPPVPYKCNSTICYGSDGGATHALFKETQYQMNRAGRALFGTKWPTISVDGFIGSRTLSSYKLLAPKVAAFVGAGYLTPSSYQVLSGWISSSRPFITDAIRKVGDAIIGRAEIPAVITTRMGSWAQEGPAKGSVPAQPVIQAPAPIVHVPPTIQPPPNAGTPPPAEDEAGAGKKSMTGGKVFIGIVAVVAAVGLVATAAYAAKRRRK